MNYKYERQDAIRVLNPSEMKKIRTTLGQGWNAATTGLEREAGGVGFRWHETHPQN